MTLLACWIAYPVVLGLLALGCGLLLERAGGFNIPGALLLPAGIAVIVVVGNFTTMTDATAELTVPAVIVLALAGLALSRPWPWQRKLDLWAVGTAAAVFAVFAAPIVLSGKATFAGYHSLDDTAIWLAFNDYVFSHGRHLPHVFSAYDQIVGTNLDVGYPLGAFVPLGVGRTLIGQDGAWLFQPYLAFAASMLALGLYTLITPLIESKRNRALIVLIAAQPALLFAFSLWSGIKEMTLVPIIALLAALVVPTLRASGGARRLLPLALGSAAVLAVFSIGGALWLLLVLGLSLGLAISASRESALRQAASFAGLAIVLALPTIITAFKWLAPAGDNLTSGGDVGRLTHGPLSFAQSFGIWPAGDFRLDPQVKGLAYLLIVVVAVSAVAGIYWAVKSRAWGPLAYIGTTVLGSLVLVSFGSTWMDAKAFAIASPALLLAGLLGAAWVFENGRREVAAALAAAIAIGVVWSNVLAYLHVPLAPRDRLAEVDRIDNRFAGQGPTLLNEDDPYPILHFLRKAQGYGPSYGPHLNRVIGTEGGPAPMTYTDLDQFVTGDLLYFRTIVLRHSPTASRPPSVYKLAWRGRFYDVWQRPKKPRSRLVAHYPLGNIYQPAVAPKCSNVTKLARLAKGADRLVALRRPTPILVALGQVPHGKSWQENKRDPTFLKPREAGSLVFRFPVQPAGRYELSVLGSFLPRLRLWVDGKLVGSDRQQLNYAGQYADLGGVDLAAGPHEIKIDYGGADLHPGSGGEGYPLGPLALVPPGGESTVTVRPENARSLCRMTLDWIEAVRS